MKHKVVFAFFLFLIAFCFLQNTALAQGAFYVEEVKEGRIYVFNKIKVYDAWKQSGELGVSITRIGAGPNGETMVFDSNEAIHLYNFKHNLPAEVIIEPEEKKPVMNVTWKDGKTTITTEKAELVISNRIQVRYTDTDVPLAVNPPGVSAGDRIGSFRMRRVKTKFDGWMYNKNLTYELQINFADTVNSLEDANLNFDLTNGSKMFMVKGGMFKVPFGRQELTSSGSQEFVDRSAVSNTFARGRDIGVQIWGMPMSGKLDWRLGVFNGNGRNVTFNDNDNFQVDGRVTYQPFGDVKYSESDFESTDRPLFAVAGQFELTEQSSPISTTLPVGLRRDLDTFGFDVVFKYKGLFLFFDDYQRTTTDKLTNVETDSSGLNFQAGYFVIPQKLEIAGRYAFIDPNENTDNNNNKEFGVAVGYFYNKHNLKLQGDYRRLDNEATNAQFDEVRVQLQFIF